MTATLQGLTKTNINSPIFITEGPGLVSLKRALKMPDGEYYDSFYCDNWLVHVTGNDSSNVRSGDNFNQSTENKFVLVGLINGEPAQIIHGTDFGGFSVTNHPPRQRSVYNINQMQEGDYRVLNRT